MHVTKPPPASVFGPVSGEPSLSVGVQSTAAPREMKLERRMSTEVVLNALRMMTTKKKEYQVLMKEKRTQCLRAKVKGDKQ
jgi:hypothetical protein